jgi:hypothetical protein
MRVPNSVGFETLMKTAFRRQYILQFKSRQQQCAAFEILDPRLLCFHPTA